MATPHVCFADELQQQEHQRERERERERDREQDHSPHNNNNNNGKNWLELEMQTTRLHHSPSLSPTPRYERNMGFFHLLSRRFGLRSSVDLVDAAAQEEDAHSSSTDSYSSASRGLAAARLELLSCASSETSSTLDIEDQDLHQQHHQQDKRKSLSRTSFSRLHRRSTSSLRRAFESLSLTSRSLSCSGPSPPPLPTPLPSQQSQQLPLKSALKSASNVELHQRQHRLATKSASSSSACSNSSASSTNNQSKAGKVKPPPQRILRQPVSYTYLKGMSGLPTQRVPRNSVCCQYARR